MSSQSASHRTASQAQVNAMKARDASPELPQNDRKASPASFGWLVAVAGAVWVSFAYVIPTLAQWLAGFTVS